MNYKIRGVELDPQPTRGKWLARQRVKVDGNGRPIYAPTRQFEIYWGLLSFEEYDDMQDHFLSIGATGSVVVDLPIYTSGSYAFQSYTGCFVNEPVPGSFFVTNYQDVRLLITNIVTEK